MISFNEKIVCYKYSSHTITISAEEHVEPAVIPRARSLVYFPSLQDCRAKDTAKRTLAGSWFATRCSRAVFGGIVLLT